MDPRVARSQAAVVRAATDLLVEGGPSAVTVDAIVGRSGVAKSTIYRHWASRDDILFAVLDECAPNILPPPPDVDFETGLRDLVRQFVEMSNDPEWTRIFPALLMLRAHEETVEHIQRRMEDKQEDALADILRRGVAEGKLRPDVDKEVVGAILLGPLVFAHLTGKLAVDQALADVAVDNALRAFAP